MKRIRNAVTRGRKSGHFVWIYPAFLVLVLIGGLVYFFLQKNAASPIRVAQVCALSTQTSRPSMDVVVALYDKDGHQVFTHAPYQVQGNQVMVQGNVIALPVEVTYQLTSLQGFFKDRVLEARYAPPPISLSMGEDSAYPYISKLPTVSPHSDFLFVPADGHPYSIYVTANGLSASRVSGPLACGLSHQAGR